MTILKRILITIIAITLMGISVFCCVFYTRDINDFQIIIAVVSIVVTIILGVATIHQTTTQIKLDKLEKTPFYRLVFPAKPDNNEYQFFNAFYNQNCIPLIRLWDNYYIDFFFENVSDINVASIEFKCDGVEDVVFTGSIEKMQEIEQQEKAIANFAVNINSATKEEIGDGYPLFKEWLKIDTNKNTNYDKRVRELILHFFYYYNCDFNQDLTPYRDDETNNDQRKEIIKRIISKGPNSHNKDKSFYDYFCENRSSIVYHLNPDILERNEKKEEIRQDIELEKLVIDKKLIVNKVVNTDRFHQFIKLPGEGEGTFEFTLILNTVHNYSYKQTINIEIDNKLFHDLSILPDEIDISARASKIEKMQNSTEYNEYIEDILHDRKELDDLKNKRAYVFVDNYESNVIEIPR